MAADPTQHNKILLGILKELENQCKFADFAYKDFSQAFHYEYVLGLEKTGVPLKSDRTFYFIQTFLVACANISKLFNPPNTKKYPELVSISNRLKTFFGLDENNVLIQRKAKSNYFVDSVVLISWDQTNQPDPWYKPDEVLRVLDPTNLNFIFEGEKFDLPKMYQELQVLFIRVHELNKMENWYKVI
jgi:hypothetical protein